MSTFLYLWWLYVILPNVVMAFLTSPGNTTSLCQGTGCTCNSGIVMCRSLGLTIIPIYQNTTTLRTGSVIDVYLDYNRIHQIPDNAFLYWTWMQVSDIHLYLGYNNIYSIEDGAFNGLEHVITYLDLSNNKLTSLSDALVLLENLQTLNVYGNPITQISMSVLKGIGNSLDDFRFSYDHVLSWPLGIRYLSVLQRLYINSSIAIPVPENAFHPDAFNDSRRSNLVLGHADYIPSAICNIPELKSLFIFIYTIDHPVIHCTPHIHLRVLQVYHGFSRFPNVLIEFPLLKSLQLAFNPKLNLIPDDMVPDNCSLVHLYLQYNNFTSVPEAIEKCTHLRVITFMYNNIRIIDTHNFYNLPDLQTIFLDGNPLIYISPIALNNLKSLSSLNLSGTNIKSIHVLSQITTLYQLFLPPSLDCTCDNLGWLNTTARQHINVYYATSSVCSENTTVTIQAYMDTSLRACP